jgi:predicted phosphodiesterase
MKLAIISDIHSNSEALEAVINSSESRVDGYICLGDIVGYGAEPNKTIGLLSGLNLLGMVLGNHDIAVLNNDFSRFRTEHGRNSLLWTRKNLKQNSRAFLENCLSRSRHLYDEYGIEIYHGGPNDIYWQYIFPSAVSEELKETLKDKNKIIFVGHSHLSFKFFVGQCQIINPGSVGQPRNGINDAQYLIFDTDSKQVEFCQVAYDIGKAAEKIKNAGLDLFLAHRLFLGI